MILHSIVSLSDIFCNTDVQAPAPEYRQINGGLIEVENGKVRRLISTDPRLYLDKRYFPRSEYK